MTIRSGFVALACAVGAFTTPICRAQALPTAAKVDTAPLELIDPDRYQVPAVLEPVRKVTLVATADGVVRSQDAKAGASVRENQEVVQMDRGEAAARLKITQAKRKEAQAIILVAKQNPSVVTPDVAQARLEAAQARVELAQIVLDRCALRAPFAGRVMSSMVSDGQYVNKGTIVALLADVSSLQVLIPVRRAGAVVGGAVNLTVEGQPVAGKIQALVPLPESQAALHELASPFTAAWVVVPNTAGVLEPGERVLSPDLPVSPIADLPIHALKGDEKSRTKGLDAGATVTIQVIRNEYVTDVPVRVIGKSSPERVQVTGSLRPSDALIVSSSVPLLAGTLIRFNSGANTSGVALEGTRPNPSASRASADVTPPRGSLSSRNGRSGPAPIGAPGSAAPRGRVGARTSAPAPEAAKPAAKTGANPPF